MKSINAFAFTLLVVLLATQNVAAKCGKTSAFRYEFENWLRRYILEVIGSISLQIEHVYNITLTESELEEAQANDFQQTLNDWHVFGEKVTDENTEIEELVKEFRLKCQGFELQKSVLSAFATKNLIKSLDDLDNTTELISNKYAADIFKDWKEFYMDQDFETLAQQQDCKKINELMESTERIAQKTEALSKLTQALLDTYGMQEWKELLPRPNEFSIY